MWCIFTARIPLGADTPPGTDTPPLGADPPRSRHPQEQTLPGAVQASGTHPTGMQSCSFKFYNFSLHSDGSLSVLLTKISRIFQFSIEFHFPKISNCQDMPDLIPSALAQSPQRQLQCLLQCYD